VRGCSEQYLQKNGASRKIANARTISPNTPNPDFNNTLPLIKKGIEFDLDMFYTIIDYKVSTRLIVTVQPYWKLADKMVCVGAYAPTHTILSDSLRFLAAQVHSVSSYD